MASPKDTNECNANLATLESNKKIEDGVPVNPTIVTKEKANRARLLASGEVTDGDEDGEEYQFGQHFKMVNTRQFSYAPNL